MSVTMIEANGVTLAYEELGDAGGRPLLLIMGLGAQYFSWPDEFCRQLADRGFHLVRYDNRDVGESTHFDEAGMPDFGSFFGGSPAPSAYQVEDMAADAAALLDGLGMAPAHVVGVSMGGMIAQALAIGHPGSVRSLTSIMSTTSPAAGPPTDEAMAVLMRPVAPTREERIEASMTAARFISSPGFEFDEEWQRQIATASYDRDPDPTGRARQLYAILTSPDRAPGLAGVHVPSLVVHGLSDPLVQPSGGRATAAALPDAELLMIEGMAHDLPRALWSQLIERIVALADRADAAR